MKHLKDLLEKKFQRVQPKNKEELKTLIKKYVTKLGNDADLNFIDTSNVIDMSDVFCFSSFNGDISQWDTSNATDMSEMFAWSEFNGDISQLDTSNLTDMDGMFAWSEFNGDISQWDVKNVKTHLFFNANSKLEDKHCPKFK